MFVTKRLERAKEIFDEYPRQFWVLVLARFVDTIGGALLFPFITLYATARFGIGMATVGTVFAAVSITGIAGNLVGGALTDRFGRRRMVLYGLIVSAMSGLALGLCNSFAAFFAVVVFIGLFTSVGGPAGGAMVADLLPEEKRAQGYGILRVAVNLSFILGPMLGGLLISYSYFALFVADAVASLITAGIVYLAIQETRPAPGEGEPEESVGQTFGGYWTVLRDIPFMLVVGTGILAMLVYINMNTTLGVYLRDTHGVAEQGYGYLLSMNAAMVVLLQFPVTRRVAKYRPLNVMAAGTFLCAIGFAMYGFATTYPIFVFAMVAITFGEMLFVPNSQAVVASFALEDMRGRYMAIFGFSGILPQAVGPLLAGLLMDNADPRLLWYVAGLLGLIAAGSYVLLQRRVERGASDVASREASAVAAGQ